MSYKADFSRFAGLSTLPGLPSLEEGMKDEAYREGRDAGAAVVQVLIKGWAKAPKENTKTAWMPVVDKYAGVQEFSKDPEWLRGFQSSLVGHFGKPIKITNESSDEADVAKVILQQMGGFGRLKAMIGAKNFSKTDNSLTFQWPSKQRSTGNALKVTLKGDDTYDMEFFNGPKSVKKYDGVYNDQLKSIFEKQTGLYLTMSAATTGEPLAEASEVESKDDLPAYAQHNVKRVEKMFGVKYSTAWEGGNGIILVFALQNPPRIVKETLKSLADLADFRWVEFNANDISIGC
jgi:hypothetical protein